MSKFKICPTALVPEFLPVQNASKANLHIARDHHACCGTAHVILLWMEVYQDVCCWLNTEYLEDNRLGAAMCADDSPLAANRK